EAIFWAGFVQIGEVNAHTPFPAGLLYQYYVRQPFQVVSFSDEPSGQESVHFFLQWWHISQHRSFFFFA
ncbi:hypothetical protein ABS207_20020, partial [Acinetobacter baumannii]|uniref:hypothetical protein n=1 Tax=Acinetobacter baumannii TaxID=470 RepID=UPI00332259C9